jgi:hypothetical protein
VKYEMKGMTLSEKVQWCLAKATANGDCMEHNQKAKRSGYGSLGHERKTIRLHRAVFEHFNGPIKNGHEICHRCDNPRCINSKHLFSGTKSDNQRDSSNKGRQALQKNPALAKLVRDKGFGKSSCRAKLSEKQVREIFIRRSAGELRSKLAIEYRVSKTIISNITARRQYSWVNVTGESK